MGDDLCQFCVGETGVACFGEQRVIDAARRADHCACDRQDGAGMRVGGQARACQLVYDHYTAAAVVAALAGNRWRLAVNILNGQGNP